MITRVLNVLSILLCGVSPWGQGGVHGSVSPDHVIAEEVGAIHCEDQLGPAVRAGGLESDGQGEIPDDPMMSFVMSLLF